jgi:predicted DCC family thiol-disulfide oxidoreductase YuxK
MFQTKVVWKVTTRVVHSVTFFFFSESRAVYKMVAKILYSQTGHRGQYEMKQKHTNCLMDN